MKAGEVKEITDLSKTTSENMAYTFVIGEIISSAKSGNDSCTVYLDIKWPRSLIRDVQNHLKSEGYKVKYKYVDDQREGDYHFFEISWHENTMNADLAKVKESVINEVESLEGIIIDLRKVASTYEKSGGSYPIARLDRDEKNLKARMCRNIANRIEKTWFTIKEHISPLSHWGYLKYDEAVCSRCGNIINTPFYTTAEAKEKWNTLPNYCGVCGACMDHNLK